MSSTMAGERPAVSVWFESPRTIELRASNVLPPGRARSVSSALLRHKHGSE